MLKSLTHLFAGTGLSQLSPTSLAFVGLLTKRWATKKQGGSTKNRDDSHPKHLGNKMFGGELIFPGQIVVRQRGTKYRPGYNVGLGVDHTLYAKTVGFIRYRREVYAPGPGWPRRLRRFIDVLPLNDEWGDTYAAKVSEMVERRSAARAALLGPRAKYLMRNPPQPTQSPAR